MTFSGFGWPTRSRAFRFTALVTENPTFFFFAIRFPGPRRQYGLPPGSEALAFLLLFPEMDGTANGLGRARASLSLIELEQQSSTDLQHTHTAKCAGIRGA